LRSRDLLIAVTPQTYVTPGATAIANIGWHYYLVFVCLTVVSIVVIYFFCKSNHISMAVRYENLY